MARYRYTWRSHMGWSFVHFGALGIHGLFVGHGIAVRHGEREGDDTKAT